MRSACCFLAVMMFVFIGCSGIQETSQEQVYRNLVDDLIWMRVGVGDDAKEFEETYPPERKAVDDLYAEFFYADGPWSTLVITAYDGEIVSAMTVMDSPGQVVFFDNDPASLRQRYNRAKVNLQMLELILSVQDFDDE